MKINIFKLKIIGMCTAVMYSLVSFGLVQNSILKTVFGILGSASLTIFAFIISEGVDRTSNINKYSLRVLACSLISAFPYHAIIAKTAPDSVSVLSYFSGAFSCLIGVLALATLNKINKRGYKLAFIILVLIVSFLGKFCAAPYFFIILFLIHLSKNNFAKMAYYVATVFFVLFAVGLVFKILITYENQTELDKLIYMIGGALPLPLFYYYNAERGPSLKWLSLIFYPVILISIFLPLFAQ